MSGRSVRRGCTYCNFNKYINKNVDEDRMLKCLVKETEALLRLSAVTEVTSIFLVEVNPTALEAHKLRDFKQAGVNRVSVGVQTLCDKDLAALGRNHTVEDSIRCVAEARALFPGRVSMDLMFARPRQTVKDWEVELQQTLEVCDRHLSLYQLTLERGTALFNAVAQKLTTVPDGDTAAEMYCVAVQMLESHGYLRYEVSNFAKPGAESLHNLWCWHGGQYIGVGPGAHGRFAPRAAESARREARIQTLEPIPWMREVERCGHATRKITPLSDLDVLEEMLVTGLRTRTGISNQTWCRLTGGTGLLEMFTAEEVVERIVASDLLHIDSSCMRATTKGLTVVDSIVVELISMLQCYWQNRYTDAETLDAKS